MNTITNEFFSSRDEIELWAEALDVAEWRLISYDSGVQRLVLASMQSSLIAAYALIMHGVTDVCLCPNVGDARIRVFASTSETPQDCIRVSLVGDCFENYVVCSRVSLLSTKSGILKLSPGRRTPVGLDGMPL